jgi:mediator of RNA polymerase II transcription subunit 10
MAQHVHTMIPMQVLADIDNARNPMQLTKDRLERAATENQFMNGKISAIDVGCFETRFASMLSFFQSYHRYLDEALLQNFPELDGQLAPLADKQISEGP